MLRSGSTGPRAARAEGRAGRRIYNDAVRDALVVLWEASDRICAKRLTALIPTLVEAMERHGHLQLGPEVRAGALDRQEAVARPRHFGERFASGCVELALDAGPRTRSARSRQNAGGAPHFRSTPRRATR